MWEMKEIRELKEGRYVNVDDEPCKIIKITTSKPGKHGSAKANIDAVSIFTGAKKSIVGPLETFEQIPIEINPDHEQPVEEGAELLYIVAMGRYKIM